MKLSRDIDLGRSLRQVFGHDADSGEQVEHDRARQTAAGNAILQRFFGRKVADRRELTILADEVGLGKTYVALAVAVSILDAIRRGEAPEGLPANRPAVLILTPTNDALFNKWMREAESFRTDCVRTEGALDWLQIASPLDGSSKSGNIADLTRRLAEATRSRPLLLIAKESALGAALNYREWWRRRALAVVFEKFRVSTDDRPIWCRAVLGSGSKQYVAELLDLRRSNELWQDTADVSPDLYRALARALREGACAQRIERLLTRRKVAGLVDAIDDLTRSALAGDWALLPLVIVDEIHGFKNPYVQARRHFERLLSGRVARFLGLSATPFQLRQDELLSILKLRNILSLPNGRHDALTDAVEKLAGAMKVSREAGEIFRKRWLALRPVDNEPVAQAWKMLAEAPESERETLLGQLRPPRLKHALAAALTLAQGNQQLRLHLRPFVIRHLHPRGYREHFVGKDADQRAGDGSPNFDWAPGLEVSGDDELTHYLMMRAVALSKDEKGLPGLGAELTGSYRHLVETAAVWKKLENATNPLLREYRAILQKMIGQRTGRRDPDAEHRKIQSTVRRAVEFFKKGQKTLIFCVYTKTAESIRDQLLTAVEKHLAIERDRVFGDASTFENFRRRFFNRREPLFSLIQDHPLLGPLGTHDAVGVPQTIALAEDALREIAQILVDAGESPETDKPDRRLLLAATEHVALLRWKSSADGRDWLFGKQGYYAIVSILLTW